MTAKKGTLLSIMITIIYIIYYIITMPNSYEVFLNDESIGFVKSINDFNILQKDVINNYKNIYKEVYIKDNIFFKKKKIKNIELSTKESLKNKYIDKSKNKIKAYYLYVDENKIGSIRNEKEAKCILNNIHEYYRNEEKCENINIKNKIILKESYIKPCEMDNVDKLYVKIIKRNIIKLKTNKKKEEYLCAKNNVIPSRGNISSDFGMRWGRMHNGIDIAAPNGSPIYAFSEGEVEFQGWIEGYGNVIFIKHSESIQTRYAHCSYIRVNKGDKVKKGGIIGNVGSTGNSTGPHLHFEIRENGIPQDPKKYLYN